VKRRLALLVWQWIGTAQACGDLDGQQGFADPRIAIQHTELADSDIGPPQPANRLTQNLTHRLQGWVSGRLAKVLTGFEPLCYTVKAFVAQRDMRQGGKLGSAVHDEIIIKPLLRLARSGWQCTNPDGRTLSCQRSAQAIDGVKQVSTAPDIAIRVERHDSSFERQRFDVREQAPILMQVVLVTLLLFVSACAAPGNHLSNPSAHPTDEGLAGPLTSADLRGW
jgi:hypothetical protein